MKCVRFFLIIATYIRCYVAYFHDELAVMFSHKVVKVVAEAFVKLLSAEIRKG